MGTYFSKASSGQRRFWYVDGFTSDEFYLSDGTKADINWQIYRELSENGYKRIIFYNMRKRFYCYDEESFNLLRNGASSQTPQRQNVERNHRGEGLKRGKWGSRNKSTDTEKTAPQKNIDVKKADVRMKELKNNALHQGIMDNDAVLAQIDSMMKNTAISTAIIVDNADNFISTFSNNIVWRNLFNDITRLPSENVNIMTFIFPDSQSGAPSDLVTLESFLGGERAENLSDRLMNVNSIKIRQPNPSEICNMLNYFRLLRGLKIRVRELPEIAKEIDRCIVKITEGQGNTSGIAKGIRIKMLYQFMENFVEKNEELTVDNCVKIFSEYNLKKIPTAQELLMDMVGMEEVKKKIVEKFQGKNPDKRAWLENEEPNRIKPPNESYNENGYMHIVLRGHPGTGKTTVAKLLGQYFSEFGYLSRGHVVEVDRSNLVAGYVGQTAILTREKVEEALGGVLFIDEAYSLSSGGEHDFGQECIDELVKLMDLYKNNLIVVFAGYPELMDDFINANPGISRRINEIITIENYTPSEMNQIVVKRLAKDNFRLSDSLARRMESFCELWVSSGDENWGNAGEAEKLVNELENEFRKDMNSEYEEKDGIRTGIIEERHITEKYREFLRPEEEVRKGAVESINSMPGLQDVKFAIKKMENSIIAGHTKIAGHYVFLGSPGTGKTTVAEKMGELFKTHKILKRGHVVSTTSGELIREVLDNNGDFARFAKKALDGVLFIDEAYQLMNTENGKDIIDSLVKFMEDNRTRLCVILAGYEDEMNDMLRTANPGLVSRIKRIYFRNYTGEELFQILVKMIDDDKEITANEDYIEFSHRAIVRYMKTHGKDKNFGNARYIRNTYIAESMDKLSERLVATYKTKENIPEDERTLLTGEDIPDMFKKYTKMKLPSDTKEKTAFDELNELSGFEELKKYFNDLKNELEIKKKYEITSSNISLHIVLKGNPGTGKTTIARLVGKLYKEMGLLTGGQVVETERKDLVAEYVGQTAPLTSSRIEQAMNGVLFIDEAYTLRRAGASGNDFGQEAIDTILKAMSDHDGEFAVVVAGYPREMDVFIQSNPGLESRFKHHFTVDDYSNETLANIFRKKCKDYEAAVSESLDNMLLPLINAMRENSRKQGRIWANGREMENLVQEMGSRWAATPAVQESENGNLMLYTEKHIPEKYLDLMEVPVEEETPEQDFRIDAEYLPESFENFKYPENLSDVEEGVVFIVIEKDGSPGYGSGFIMADNGYIITCNHVVDGASSIRVRLKMNYKGKERTDWCNAKVIHAEKELDIAMIKIDAYRLPELPMSRTEVKTSDGLFILGYPFGAMLSDNLDSLALSKFRGEVSSIQIKNDIESIFINMEAKSGCSGAPVFSIDTGDIVGILCGSQTSKNGNLVEEINYIRPVKYIFERFIKSDEKKSVEEETEKNKTVELSKN